MHESGLSFNSGLKLAFNSCLHAKLGLRIEDTRKIAGILNFKDGELEGKHAIIVWS